MKNAAIMLGLFISFSLITVSTVKAKSNIKSYDTCFTTASGSIKQIRSIAIKGDRLVVVGPLKSGKKILPSKKRTFKISKAAKYYMAEDISKSRMTKKKFAQTCRSISSYSSSDTLKAFSFSTKGKNVVKLVYYP